MVKYFYIMAKKQSIQIFEGSKVRTAWDDTTEEWYFSIVDVCGVLTNSQNPKRYWSDLKKKLKQEGNETYEKIVRLKLPASDGKMRMTDVATVEQLFRIIQSIPSPKAEPFKLWMAEVARQRLEQAVNPELAFEQAVADYRRLGYSEAWINQRMKSIEVRKNLTDEWDRTGVKKGRDYALLTDIITRQWSGFTTKEYKRFKGLTKESLRDNMTNIEIALNMLAEASATEISRQRDPRGLEQQKKVAKDGGSVARAARRELESKTGHSAVTSARASDYLLPPSQEEETS